MIRQTGEIAGEVDEVDDRRRRLVDALRTGSGRLPLPCVEELAERHVRAQSHRDVTQGGSQEHAELRPFRLRDVGHRVHQEEVVLGGAGEVPERAALAAVHPDDHVLGHEERIGPGARADDAHPDVAGKMVGVDRRQALDGRVDECPRKDPGHDRGGRLLRPVDVGEDGKPLHAAAALRLRDARHCLHGGLRRQPAAGRALGDRLAGVREEGLEFGVDRGEDAPRLVGVPSLERFQSCRLPNSSRSAAGI